MKALLHWSQRASLIWRIGDDCDDMEKVEPVLTVVGEVRLLSPALVREDCMIEGDLVVIGETFALFPSREFGEALIV